MRAQRPLGEPVEWVWVYVRARFWDPRSGLRVKRGDTAVWRAFPRKGECEGGHAC